MGCCCSFPRGDGSTLTSAAETTVDVLLSAHKVDDHTPKDVVGEVTTDRHSGTSLEKCDHKSHYGHELVYRYLMEQKGFEFISHDEPYKGRQPDLMFWWLRGTTKVLVIVEVKDMRKNTQDAKSKQVKTLLDQCERYKGNIQISKECVFGFLSGARTFYYLCSFGSHHKVIRNSFVDLPVWQKGIHVS